MNDQNGTYQQFRDALRELVIASGHVTKTGNVNWHGFASEVDGFHYETLRKVLAGERRVTPAVVKAVATALDVSPDYFVEFRLEQIRRCFDVTQVGFEDASRNLKHFEGRGLPARNTSVSS